MKKLTNGVIQFWSSGFYGIGYATPMTWIAGDKPLWAWFFSFETWSTHKQLVICGFIFAIPAK
jgi:hypothetical protein